MECAHDQQTFPQTSKQAGKQTQTVQPVLNGHDNLLRLVVLACIAQPKPCSLSITITLTIASTITTTTSLLQVGSEGERQPRKLHEVLGLHDLPLSVPWKRRATGLGSIVSILSYGLLQYCCSTATATTCGARDETAA